MKRIILLLPIALLLFNVARSQQKVDYIEIRKDLVKSTCATMDIEIYKQDLANLLSFDTTAIGKGLSQYYFDLGMTYSTLSNRDTTFLPLALKAMVRCAELDRKNGNAYLSLSIYSYLQKDIAKAKAYARLHKKYTRKKYRDNEFLAMLEKK